MIGRLLLAALLAASAAYTQRGGRGATNPDGSPMNIGFGAPRQTKIEAISSRLKLDKTQKTEVEAILDAAQQEAVPLRDTLSKGREAIALALVDGRTADDQAVMRSAPTRLDILTTNLKLKSAQEKQIRNALDDIQKDAAPVRDEMAAKRARIAEAVQAGQAQSEIDAAVTAYAATDARMAALEMKAFAGIYQALDPDQRKAAAPAFNMMSGIF